MTALDWDTSLPDWERRIMAGDSLVPPLPLFQEEADRAERIFRRLRVPDMHGLPRMEDVAGPWLYPIVRAIFGSFNPETNRRMIQEYFWLIPKKNGKSSTAATLMVEALILNRRPEGEHILVAPTKEIAEIAFRQASGTIRADSELEKLFQIQHHIRLITHRRTGATLKVKAADTDVITGGKQCVTFIDELHVLASKKDAADIMVELRGALAARPDGMLIIVTTQSKAEPAGVFKSELAKARAVRDGKLKLPLLPILYELPKAHVEEWREKAFWHVVNPNLGRSVDIPFLERELDAKEHEGPAALALFASQHFNVEIGVGLSQDGWPGAAFWERAVDPSLSLEEILRRSDVVCVGIDGGGLADLFGLAVLGRDARTREWLLWVHAWAFTSVLERFPSEVPRLRDFEKQGDLTIIDTLGDDIVECVDIVADINNRGLLAHVGLDPIGVGAVVDALAEVGIDDGAGNESARKVYGVSQGFRLSGAIKTMERKLADGTLRACNQRLMAYCVSNAKVEPKGNSFLVTRAASGYGKIDPLMAAFNACALMAGNPQPASGGVELFALG